MVKVTMKYGKCLGTMASDSIIWIVNEVLESKRNITRGINKYKAEMMQNMKLINIKFKHF